ncbi:GPO family capsid scaffolding protein [Gibbsiella greigii]
MAKKVSKWFRIGVEGDTCDGREIDANDIQQMGGSYNPKVYGARINMEHIRGILPTGEFRRYGDVIELKAEQIDEPDEPRLHGKWALYAKITPTADLVAMVGDGQKVYTSMEIARNFAKTGTAYLQGLAVTDDPASLGTEMLEFSRNAKTNPLAARKADPANVFSVATEALIEFEDLADPELTFAARIKGMFSRKQVNDDARQADMQAAVTAVAEQVQGAEERFNRLESTLTQQVADLKTQIDDKGSELADLKQQLASTESPQFARRPVATGGNGHHDHQTDC